MLEDEKLIKSVEGMLLKYIQELEGGEWVCPDSEDGCGEIYANCNTCFAKAILALPLLAALLDIYYQTAGVCPKCKGTGRLDGYSRLKPHEFYPQRLQCYVCKGTGKTYDIKRVAVLAKDQDLPDCLHGDIFGSCPAIKANFKRVEVQG